MSENFYCYKHIISFNGKTKSKDQWLHGEKKGVIWHGVKGERDSSSVQQMLNQDSCGVCIWGMSGVVNAILSEWVCKLVMGWWK